VGAVPIAEGWSREDDKRHYKPPRPEIVRDSCLRHGMSREDADQGIEGNYNRDVVRF
jgi:hypothetical protein